MISSSSASHTLCLLILTLTSTFYFSISQVEVVSGDDNNASGEMGSEVLTSFRFLLGFHNSKSREPAHSFAPAPVPMEEDRALAPAPAPAPAPVPAQHTPRIHHRFPFPHKLHNQPEDGERNHRGKSRLHTIIIVVVTSAGSLLAVVFSVAAFLVCKRARRKRIRSSSGRNKVSYDPGPGPELFHLNSLTPILDIESSIKSSSEDSKNMLSNESLSSYYNPSNDGKPVMKPESETLSCGDEEIIHKNSVAQIFGRESSTNKLDDDEPKKCESDIVSCVDEEIIYIESVSSDYDESFHSVCNSRSSSVELASGSNLSYESGKSSPYSSNGSSPPKCTITYFPSSKTKQTCSSSQIFRNKTSQSPVSSHINELPCNGDQETSLSKFAGLDLSNEDLTSILKSTNSSKPPQPPPLPLVSTGNIPKPPPPPLPLVSTGNIPKPPPPPLPSESNGNIPKPPPPSMPSISNGNIPKPPPPPLPPLIPPTSQTAFNSSHPPPPPPGLLQRSTPVGKDGTPLPKLKPLHWDKVRAAPDRSMVWDKIKSSSFELDEQMIESLFGYNTQSLAKTEEAKAKSSSPGKHVLDNKRLQNITILLKALNATSEQVCEALIQGRGLNSQQLEALVKMVPTKEEEDKLCNYEGDVDELGSAEKFVKQILNIPFAFSRIQVMLFRETFEDEVVHLKKSFAMLEEACKELRSSRLFFRLLEAVLKTGNRMNVGTIRGGARAFKLDTLLKLADVKGTDGKTTLLHFVVQEIIRSEGVAAMEKSAIKKNKPKTAEEREEAYRVMGLDIVSGLSTELCNVKKTASVDLDVLASSVSNLREGMKQLKQLVEVELSDSERNGSFVNSMRSFLGHAEGTMRELGEDEDLVLVRVREITEYYHGDVSKVDEANPLRIFVIVRDFLGMLDRVCKQVRSLKAYSGPTPAVPFR